MTRVGDHVLIALDPANNFGWAVFCRGRRMRSGTWRLKRKYTKFAELISNLSALIDDCHRRYRVYPRIAFESVAQRQFPAAHRLYGGWLACFALLRCRYPQLLPFEEQPVGTWKMRVTGKGDASKEEYVKVANAKYRLKLTVKKNEDEAAAIGVGLSAIGWRCAAYEARTKVKRNKRRG